MEWEVVVYPQIELRSVDKRMALWADATAAAFAAAASDEAALSSQASGGSSMLIKAHNRSAEAEAYVHAAAAARTLSATHTQRMPTPPRLMLPAAISPARSAPTAPTSLPPLSPYRQSAQQLSPARPPPSPYRHPVQQLSPQLSPSRTRRALQARASSPPRRPSLHLSCSPDVEPGER